jgi:hypothetical protein
MVAVWSGLAAGLPELGSHLVHHWMNGLAGGTVAWPVVGVHIRQVILGHGCFFGTILLFFINFVFDWRWRRRRRGRGRRKEEFESCFVGEMVFVLQLV